MMASLGPVTFNLKNDLSGISQSETSHFARHEVFRAPPVYEDTGDDESTLSLTGTLRPFLFEGALDALSALRAIRAAKLPVPFMRGDFVPVGWFIIDEISVEHTMLDPFTSVGQEIEFSVELLKSGPPTSTGAITTLLRMFG